MCYFVGTGRALEEDNNKSFIKDIINGIVFKMGFWYDGSILYLI